MYREQRFSCFFLDHIASQPLPRIKRDNSSSEMGSLSVAAVEHMRLLHHCAAEQS